MNLRTARNKVILGILFFLPVLFLLILSRSENYYNTLSIVEENVMDISGMNDSNQLRDHLTVLGFLGNSPMDNSIMALNLKEMIYDKFRGFKNFQVIMLVTEDARSQVHYLQKELYAYDIPKYWHFVYTEEHQIQQVFESLNSREPLDTNFATDHVFIIDKDLNQRGRLDDRTPVGINREEPVYGLVSYDCIEVAELKNKMGDDIRILFTEYRQKRKGNFDSSKRRAEDIKGDEQS